MPLLSNDKVAGLLEFRNRQTLLEFGVEKNGIVPELEEYSRLSCFKSNEVVSTLDTDKFCTPLLKVTVKVILTMELPRYNSDSGTFASTVQVPTLSKVNIFGFCES